ncbi:MAG: type IV secretion system protein [Neisseriaceae bacterium]|nr:type IV secretion system protein [Neisseriaceae bacterium]
MKKYNLLSLIIMGLYVQPNWALTDWTAQVQRHEIFLGHMKKMDEQIKFYVKMIDQYKAQLEQMKQTVNALKGKRSVAVITDGLSTYLPPEWAEFVNKIPVTRSSSDILLKDRSQQLIESYNHIKYQFDTMGQRMENIAKLAEEARKTEDLKSAQDLNNRIEIEKMAIAESTHQFQVMKDMLEYEEKMQHERRRLEDRCADQQYRHIYSGRPISDECKKIIKEIRGGHRQNISSKVNQQNGYRGNNSDTNNGWKLGQTSKKYESGNRGAGAINGAEAAKKDKGGWSYGTYQIATNPGTINQYLKTSKYKDDFKGLKAGTTAFNKKWKEVYRRDPIGFEKDQHDFIKRTHYEPQLRKLKKNGIDLYNRGVAIQDLIWSSSVQHGANTDVILKSLKGKDVNKMTNAQIINAVQDRRKKSYSQNKDTRTRASLLNRAKEERQDLLRLNQ